MALVTIGTYLNILMLDAAGNKASLNLNLDYADLDALHAGDVLGDVDAIITDLEAVTGARVESYSFGEKVGEDTPGFGAADSEVENIALITSAIDGAPQKKHSLRIPAPVIGVFLGTTGENKNIVDTADADLQAWLANFGTTGHVLVSDGESIADPTVAGNFKGKRIHRASRKG